MVRQKGATRRRSGLFAQPEFLNQDSIPPISRKHHRERVMEKLSSYPDQAYDYIYGNYGTVGLIVTGVAVVVGVICIFIWFDRSK
jgi:hypothetical protein